MTAVIPAADLRRTSALAPFDAAVAALGEVARELADAGGLGGAVDARDHDHRRPHLAQHQRPLQPWQPPLPA